MKVADIYYIVLLFVTLLRQSTSAFHLFHSKTRIFRQNRNTIEMTSTTIQQEDDFDESSSTTSSPSLLISLRNKLSSKSTSSSVDDDTGESLLACLFLASQSPRRREILDMMGLAGKYSCEPPPLDETLLQNELVTQNLHPTIYTKRLAEAKAHSLAAKHAANECNNDIPILYLGSDTVVDIDDKILEKPKDEAQAKVMLRKLSGQEVCVFFFFLFSLPPFSLFLLLLLLLLSTLSDLIFKLALMMTHTFPYTFFS